MTDPLAALVTDWQSRSERYAEQAKRLDEKDRPLDALRLGTYALMWSLAARELNDALKDRALSELPGYDRLIAERLHEAVWPKPRLSVVPTREETG